MKLKGLNICSFDPYDEFGLPNGTRYRQHNNPFISFGIGIQAFAELGRTTLGSANSSIAVTGLANKKWLIVLVYSKGTAAADTELRINGDSGNNYAYRESISGAADSTSTSTNLIGGYSTSPNDWTLNVFFIENITGNEHLVYGYSIANSNTGATNVPARSESVGKWVTTSAITEIDIINTNSTTFVTGSECVVLGSDPSDTNVAPFFVELNRATGSTSSVTISGVTSKKYNMFFAYAPSRSAASTDPFIRMGSGSVDTGTNYASRRSIGGGGDSTVTSQSGILLHTVAPTGWFLSGFFINVAANEKLMIAWGSEEETSGAGNAPNRGEYAGKWVNTSNQADNLSIYTGGLDTWGSGTELVWYGAN